MAFDKYKKVQFFEIRIALTNKLYTRTRIRVSQLAKVPTPFPDWWVSLN